MSSPVLRFLRRCLAGAALLLGALPAAALPPDFTLTNIMPGLTRGTSILQVADGRIFATELGGALKTWKNGASYTVHTFPTSNARSEQGLFGLAADPNYASNGYLYVHYFVYVNGGDQDYHVIQRVTVSPPLNGDPQLVAGSQRLVYRLPNLPAGASRHNGGQIQFGADGYLWMPKGDGERQETAENNSNVFGTLIRIDPHSTSASNDDVNGHYGIPSGNAGLAKPEIFAYGFRNPWSFVRDPQTGDFFLGDVGGTEEVNRIIPSQHRGKRFGWGPGGNSGMYNCADAAFVCPMLYYNGGAITGVAVKRGAAGNWPAQYRDAVYYSDHNASWIRYTPVGQNNGQAFNDNDHQPLGLAFGAVDGNLYYARYNGGGLWMIRYEGAGDLPPSITSHPASQTVPSGRSATFAVAATGAGLAYRWQYAPSGGAFSDLSDGGAFAGTATATLTVAVTEARAGQYRARVTNAAGSATSNAAILTVTPPNAPPVIAFSSPADNAFFTVPEPIAFAATASDPEQGQLPASAFRWEVEMGHRTSPTQFHTHPVTFFDGVRSGSFPSTVAGETSPDVWLLLILTVTDAAGNIVRDTLTLWPNLVTLRAESDPPGLQVVLMDPVTTDRDVRAVIGNDGRINAAASQILGGARYDFSHWSFSGDVPAGLTTTTGFQNFEVPHGPAVFKAHYVRSSTPAFHTLRAVDNEYVSLLADNRLQSTSTTASGSAFLFALEANGDGSLGILSAANGLYCQVTAAGVDVTCDASSASAANAKWVRLDQADGKTAFRNVFTNQHLVAEGGGSQPLKANRGAISDWEKFTVALQDGGPTTYGITLAVESGSGTLSPAAGSTTQVAQGGSLAITATPAAGYVFAHWHASAGLTLANANSASTQVTGVSAAGTVQAHFEPSNPTPGEAIAIRAVDNEYVSLLADNRLQSTSTTVAGNAFLFTLAANGDGTQSLKSTGNGLFCQVAAAGADVTCDAASASAANAKWVRLDQADGMTALRNVFTGQHLVAEGGGGQPLKANRDAISGWEKFTVVPQTGGPTTYGITLEIESGSGTLSPAAGTTTQVAQGGSLAIAATPAAGYVFAHWHASAGLTLADANSASTQVTGVSAAGTVRAHFEAAPQGNAQTLQAENAAWSGPTLQTGHSGWRGTGFLDYTNAAGDHIQWSVSVAQAGAHTLAFRYALQSGSRPLKLTVNGTDVVSSLGFASTGSWSTWAERTVTVSLAAGANTIRLTAIGSSGGNFDELTVSPAGAAKRTAEEAFAPGAEIAWLGLREGAWSLAGGRPLSIGLAGNVDDAAAFTFRILTVEGREAARLRAPTGGAGTYLWDLGRESGVKPGLYFYRLDIQGLRPLGKSGRILVLP